MLNDPDPKVLFSCAALLRSFEHQETQKAEEVCDQFIKSVYPEDRLLLVDCLSSLENLEKSFFIRTFPEFPDKKLETLFQTLFHYRLRGG